VIVDALAKLIGPGNVAELPLLNKTPLLETPVPLIVNASLLTYDCPLKSRDDPSFTTVPAAIDPNAVELPSFIIPLFIVVKPVNVFAPDKVQVPVPVFVIAVVPEPSTIVPAISPVPADEPWSVTVFTPIPVAVKALVNLSNPVPD